MEFLNSLKKRLKHYSSPFDHWELNEPLTKEALEEICKTEIADLSKANLNYDGTRAIDGGGGEFRKGISTGGKAKKFRCYIEKDNSKDFPHLANLRSWICSYVVFQPPQEPKPKVQKFY